MFRRVPPRSILVSKLTVSERIRDFEFRDGLRNGLPGFSKGFRRSWEDSQDRTKSGRLPLATFCVRLLRDGHYRRTSHARFDIKLHLVWITKYRKKLLRDGVGGRYLRGVCEQLPCPPVQGRGCPSEPFSVGLSADCRTHRLEVGGSSAFICANNFHLQAFVAIASIARSNYFS